MDIKHSWVAPLSRLCPEVHILVTVGTGRRSDISLSTHPGTWGRVLRASTHRKSEPAAASGRLIPYWPTIQEWPNITYQYEPQSRRVADVSCDIKILNQAGFYDNFFMEGHPAHGWAQVDLWTPGTPLEDSVTAVAGPVTSVRFDSPNSSVVLQVTDTYDGHLLEFPFTNEFLDLDEFPYLSEELIGKARRIFLLNVLKDFLPCTPISKDMREYYVCEPVMSQMPNEVWVGSERVTRGQSKFRRGIMASTGQEFTKLVFSDRIESLGYTGSVYARGGSGPNTENPVRFFLDRIPKMQLTNRALGHLHDIDRQGIFDYFVVVNNRGPVLDIIRDRLLPMSHLIGFFRGGRFDTIKQGDATRIVNLTMHSELQHRLPSTPSETPIEQVYNAIDVRYRRNFQSFTGELSRYAVHIDKGYGGLFGKHLARSEELYGRRFLSIDAADLTTPEDAERLGISMLAQTAFPHRTYRYNIGYRHGLALDINDRVRLTDSFIQVNRVNCRVTIMQFLPTGINVTLQSEDSHEMF